MSVFIFKNVIYKPFVYQLVIIQFPVYVDCSDDQNDTAQRIVSEQANVFFKYIHKQMELKQTTESLRNKRKTDPIVTINPKIPKLQ